MAIAQQTFEQLKTAGLAEVDPEIAELLGREADRQRGQIELIASENFTWPSILEAVSGVPTNNPPSASFTTTTQDHTVTFTSTFFVTRMFSGLKSR